MISFFKRIRRKLLENKRLRKYALYAIGEIILVMVGILLAVQVNNANNAKKLGQVELEILSEIRTNLFACKEMMQKNYNSNHQRVEALENLLNHMDSDSLYDHRFDKTFFGLSQWNSPFFTTSGYKSLQSKGVDLIKDKALRTAIVQLHDRTFGNIQNGFEKTDWVYYGNVVFEFLSKHVRSNHQNDTALPNNYESLRKNTEFINIVSEIKLKRFYGAKVANIVKSRIDEVVELIENELKDRRYDFS